MYASLPKQQQKSRIVSIRNITTFAKENWRNLGGNIPTTQSKVFPVQNKELTTYAYISHTGNGDWFLN